MTDTSKELSELLPCPFCGGDAGDTYYQLGWFISCKHCSASTEVTNAKARAVEAWNRRAPAVPVPQFNHSAKRKLNYLLEAGETITGYAFQNKDGRRGSIDCHGFVAWWHDAAAPQPPEADHIPDQQLRERIAGLVRPLCERIKQFDGDRMPEGDMGNPISAAAPVQLPEPAFWYCESKTPDAIWPIGRTTKKRESAFKDGHFNQQALYTEQQVRQLLAAHGIGKDKA